VRSAYLNRHHPNHPCCTAQAWSPHSLRSFGGAVVACFTGAEGVSDENVETSAGRVSCGGDLRSLRRVSPVVRSEQDGIDTRCGDRHRRRGRRVSDLLGVCSATETANGLLRKVGPRKVGRIYWMNPLIEIAWEMERNAGTLA